MKLALRASEDGLPDQLKLQPVPTARACPGPAADDGASTPGWPNDQDQPEAPAQPQALNRHREGTPSSEAHDLLAIQALWRGAYGHSTPRGGQELAAGATQFAEPADQLGPRERCW